MNIVIQLSDPEPVYEQIVRQIRQAIASGDLRPGVPLPSVRQLATDLQLNRNTVARAYKILEDQGVLLTAGRKGTFVKQGAAHEVTRHKAGRAQRAVAQLIEALRIEGLSHDEIAELFKTALKGARE